MLLRRALGWCLAAALSATAVSGCDQPPATPASPPPPARVAFRVAFSTLSVIDDKESGSGDWRVSLAVDGNKLGAPILGEADSGASVELRRDARSEGLLADHKIVVTMKVEEHDGGFDNTWNLIGEVTQTFGKDEDWGVGGHRVPMETDEGKVEVLFQILRLPANDG